MMMRYVATPSRFLSYSNRTSVLLGSNTTHLRNFSDFKEGTTIGEKARSTAEEFSRQAKEKAESTTERVKEAWEDAKQAVNGDHREAKEKYKEKVEKGKYDNIGQESQD